MNTIEDNTSNVALCNSDDNGQGLGEAANNLGVYIWARAGQNRINNIVQDIVQQMLRVRAGRSYKYFGEITFEQGGVKPQQEYSPEQRSG